MTIEAPHPSLTDPRTYMTAEAAAAATALTVANNGQFTANDYIVKGVPGQEGAELKKISTVSGNNTINVVGTALKFPAAINTPISFIKYNKVRFYLGDWSARYSTGRISVSKNSAVVTGSGTSWGSITTAYALLLNDKWYDIKSVDSTTQITLTETYKDEDLVSAPYALVPFTDQTSGGVDIAIDQESTLWDDTDALTEDFYRTEYYNSTTTFVSAKSPIIAAAEQEGFGEFSLRVMVDEVLSDLSDTNAQRRSRDAVARDINNCLRAATNKVVTLVQEDYLDTYTPISFRAGEPEYPLPSDFRKLSNIWISFDGNTFEKGNALKVSQMYPEVNYAQTAPYYLIRDNMLMILPTPTADLTIGAKMWYERRIPSLKKDGDELPHIFRDFKRMFVDYALAKACIVDDQGKAIAYDRDAKQAMDDMVVVLSDRDLGQTKQIEVVQDAELFE